MSYRMRYEYLVLKCLNGKSRHGDFLALGDAGYFDLGCMNLLKNGEIGFDLFIGLGASIQRIWVLADRSDELDIEIDGLKEDLIKVRDSKQICDLIDKIENLIKKLNLKFT